MRTATLLLLPILLLVANACSKKPPAVDHSETARTLFLEHRNELPRTAADLPFPMDEKYWSYALDLGIPSPEALSQETQTGFISAEQPERYVIAAHLLRRGEPPTDTELAAMDQRVLDFLRGIAPPDDVPDIDAYAGYVAERKATLADALVGLFSAAKLEQPLASSGDPDEPTEDFALFARAMQERQRLRLLALLATEHGFPELAPILQSVAADKSAHPAYRVIAARAAYALGDKNVRDLLMFLSFGSEEARGRYGWETYRALADAGDAETYTLMRSKWETAEGIAKDDYLKILARYGKPEDLQAVIDYARAGLPRMEEQTMAPTDEREQTSQLVESPYKIHLIQDGAAPPDEETAPEQPEANPHDLSAADMDALVGYALEDREAADRFRLLKHFDLVAHTQLVLPVLHEGLLKGGPVTRVVCGELLAVAGDQSSLELLHLAWEDEKDGIALAELARAYLVIDRRVKASAPK